MNKTKLALVFPGLGYGPDRPLLYYAGKLVREAGYNLVTVSYGDLPRVERPSPGKPLDTGRLEECFALALERVMPQLKNLPKADGPASGGGLILISKSIGTAVGAAWAASRGLSPRQILYTPVARTFDFPLVRSIAFHGTADPWLGNEECTDGCRRAGVPLYTFEGANHSLECGGVQESIRNLAGAMRLTEEFIGGKLR